MSASFSRAPLPLLTAEEMRRWDRRAIDQAGVPERVLMEAAGRAAARVVQRLYPRGPVVAAVGKGNNGGDAVVALRCLQAWGRDVVAIPVGGSELPAELCHGWKIQMASLDEAAGFLRGAGVLVDGLLGTGASGPPRDAYAAAIRALNAAETPIVALDGPSGVDLTDGSVPGEAVRADVTVAFGAPKRGLLRFPGRVHAGRILVAEVGFPPLAPTDASAAVIVPAWARATLAPLPPDAHKGTAGSVAVVAGRSGMGGAAIMVATGALRAGAGMVRVISAEANRLAVQAVLPEAIFVDRHGDDLDEALAASDALVIGPGIGTDDESHSLVRRILSRAGLRAVIDADALTLLSRDPGLVPGGDAILLTPHPGEMARLLSVDLGDVLRDPFAAVQEAARRFGCAVLLKGWPSLVARGDEPVLANVTGHSGVATGGMGDTLAGIAGAFLALGLEGRDAGALAIHFAGRAAELAGRGRSLLPRDVAEALSEALMERLPDPDGDFPDVLLDLPPAA